MHCLKICNSVHCKMWVNYQWWTPPEGVSHYLRYLGRRGDKKDKINPNLAATISNWPLNSKRLLQQQVQYFSKRPQYCNKINLVFSLFTG